MAEDVRVTNLPSSDSHYRIALELASRIAGIEKKVTRETAREYFLELYHQCHRVVRNGDTPQQALGLAKRPPSFGSA